jgi:F0F1-type ATP synthase assembly protein I
VSDVQAGIRVEPEQNDHTPAGRGKLPNPWRYAGMGTELAAGVAAFILIGYWIDSKFDTGRMGVIVGAIVGCAGGFYHFLRQAVKLQRESEQALKRRRSNDADDDQQQP